MPTRGKTPKRIGRTRTPKFTAVKTPSRQADNENNGSSDVFKTPKIPTRSARAGKTPGWYSPTEDTFKLPSSPSPPSRRVTRRSTVYKVPEYSSFIPLSPRRTRRSSVYQKRSTDPAEPVQKATRRSSILTEKPKPPTSARRASVYKKKSNEQLVENLGDTSLVKPSAPPKRNARGTQNLKFSPIIRTRRQSILPKNSSKCLESTGSGIGEKSREVQKASKVPVATKKSTLQKPTMSSAAKARARSRSPVKTLSVPTSNESVKTIIEEQKTVFVDDLLDLVPKVARNSPKLVRTVRRASSAIVLSPMGARTKAVIQLDRIDSPVLQDSDLLQDKEEPKSVRRETKSAMDISSPVSSLVKKPSPELQKDTPTALKRKSSKDVPLGKKQKLEESVYATPTFESPRVALRRKVTSQIALSPSTPEFLTPVGNLKKKRKGTPMRPGLQKSLQLAQSTPDVTRRETPGIRPAATRKTRQRATRQTHHEEPVPVIDGQQVLDKKEFTKEGIDFVDAALVKEPLSVASEKSVEAPAPVQSAARCTIL